LAEADVCVYESRVFINSLPSLYLVRPISTFVIEAIPDEKKRSSVTEKAPKARSTSAEPELGSALDIFQA
jgi:hypothetical protein